MTPLADRSSGKTSTPRRKIPRWGGVVALASFGIVVTAVTVAASALSDVDGITSDGTVRLPAPVSAPRPGPGAGSLPSRPGTVGIAGLAGPGWTVTEHRLTSQQSQRDYLLARPVTVTVRPLPVLVVLHGRRMTPAQTARLSGFPALLRQAIVVYPAGLGDSWNAGACCGAAHALGTNDVQFVTDVVGNVLSTQRDASPTSVFLVGYSNGGRLAYQMACLRPGLFAAVAVVEAVPVASCSQTVPVPLLVVASAGDPFVNLDGRRPRTVIGGYVEPTVDQVLREWRTRDGCAPSANVTIAGELTATTWAGCRSPAQVEFDLYAGNRHQWPIGNAATPSAQAESWAFFQRISRAATRRAP